jgi:hypothetical protein
MLIPLKHVSGRYKSLIVKMHINAPKSELVRESLDLWCDFERILALPCILPMLEVVHTLIKYAQRQDVFICEFIDAMKLTKAKIQLILC